MIKEYTEHGWFVVELNLGGFEARSTSRDGKFWTGDIFFEKHLLKACSSIISREMLLDMEERGLEQCLEDWCCIPGGVRSFTYIDVNKLIVEVYGEEGMVERHEFYSRPEYKYRSVFFLEDGRVLIVYPYGYYFVTEEEYIPMPEFGYYEEAEEDWLLL